MFVRCVCSFTLRNCFPAMATHLLRFVRLVGLCVTSFASARLPAHTPHRCPGTAVNRKAPSFRRKVERLQENQWIRRRRVSVPKAQTSCFLLCFLCCEVICGGGGEGGEAQTHKHGPRSQQSAQQKQRARQTGRNTHNKQDRRQTYRSSILCSRTRTSSPTRLRLLWLVPAPASVPVARPPAARPPATPVTGDAPATRGGRRHA